MIDYLTEWEIQLAKEMIEMGVDVFQGAVSTNHIPELIQKYGGKITIMGGPESTYPGLYEAVSEVLSEFDPVYFPLK